MTPAEEKALLFDLCRNIARKSYFSHENVAKLIYEIAEFGNSRFKEKET